MTLRGIRTVVQGQDTSDGAGVRLRRSIGTGALDHLDPFLLFDEFKSDRPGDYIAGFPDHPHRGFETVTYMLAGRMEHRDHSGNRGDLAPGSVQWMTAGRGIIHSEMPQQEDGLMWGFQLWVNLPADRKMTAPRYQDIPPEDVPEVVGEGTRVRILAGRLGEAEGPVRDIVTHPLYLDVRLEPDRQITVPVPAGHNAFVYPFEGEGQVGVGSGSERVVPSGSLAVLNDGDTLQCRSGDSALSFVLLAGEPIGEPIARYGPFVMNTPEEIQQAFADYRNGTLAG